jgi:hypothetical protein
MFAFCPVLTCHVFNPVKVCAKYTTSGYSQNRWACGLCQSFGILNNRNRTCFRFHMSGGRQLLCRISYKELTSIIGPALSKGPNRVGVCLLSSKVGNRSNFQNLVLSDV